MTAIVVGKYIAFPLHHYARGYEEWTLGGLLDKDPDDKEYVWIPCSCPDTAFKLCEDKSNKSLPEPKGDMFTIRVYEDGTIRQYQFDGGTMFFKAETIRKGRRDVITSSENGFPMAFAALAMVKHEGITDDFEAINRAVGIYNTASKYEGPWFIGTVKQLFEEVRNEAATFAK